MNCTEYQNIRTGVVEHVNDLAEMFNEYLDGKKEPLEIKPGEKVPHSRALKMLYPGDYESEFKRWRHEQRFAPFVGRANILIDTIECLRRVAFAAEAGSIEISGWDAEQIRKQIKRIEILNAAFSEMDELIDSGAFAQD